jgi:fimbrial chaperone protein
MRVQVRAFAWRQVGGKEQLLPTRELVVSPPMLDLAAGGRRLVRVLYQGPKAEGEIAYRVVVDELPPSDAQRKSGAVTPGLSFRLRYSLPVFIGAAEAAEKAEEAPQLFATASLLEDGSISFALRNAGQAHAQVARLSYVNQAGQRKVLVPGLLGYVLAGSEMIWKLPPGLVPAQGGGGHYEAMINGEQFDRSLPFDAVHP